MRTLLTYVKGINFLKVQSKTWPCVVPKNILAVCMREEESTCAVDDCVQLVSAHLHSLAQFTVKGASQRKSRQASQLPAEQ